MFYKKYISYLQIHTTTNIVVSYLLSVMNLTLSSIPIFKLETSL